MELFGSDAEFWKAFMQFDALAGSEPSWEMPLAERTQADLFGDRIALGQRYFRRPNPRGGAMIRLSGSSMERVLFSAVTRAPWLAELGDCLLEERADGRRRCAARSAVN